MIPQKLEEVLKSDFSFLEFGTKHPESLAYAEITEEGNVSPTYVFGPEDDKSELHFHLRPTKVAENKVAEMRAAPGVVDFYLSPGINHYRMHMKKETMPSNLKYTSVSWDELMS